MVQVFKSPAVTVVRSSILGKTVLFAVDQPKDVVQKHHLKGRFYEADELHLMTQAFPKGGRFLDIGANIGNHSVFFGKIMDASHILPIEVNPRVVELLRTNLILNGLEVVSRLDFLGLGLDNVRTETASIHFRERNIGGARVAQSGGGLSLVRGDDIIDEPFDLVKIDVEGAEIRVLQGLEGFISRFKPTLFIEVDNVNAEQFRSWLESANYRIIDQFQRYKVNVNYLVSPA